MIRLTGTNEADRDQDPQRRRLDGADRHGRGGAAGGRSWPRRRPHEHLHRQEHAARRAGDHRPRRLVPREADDRVRHAGGRRRHAGEGRPEFEGKVPVFNTVADAVQATGANTSVIYVPPMCAADAIIEAGRRRRQAHRRASPRACRSCDMTRVPSVRAERGARLIGPNCPGLITPGTDQGRHHPRQHLHRRAASAW